MSKRILYPIVLAVVLALMCLAYSQRGRIESRLWHFRHGNTLEIGKYTVPIPENWYATSIGEGQHIAMRTDTEDRSVTKRLKTRAAIGIRLSTPVKDYVAKEEIWLQSQTGGSRPASQRIFHVDGDTLLCTGGELVASGGIPDIAPVGWNCKSDGGLTITVVATPPDMPQTWEIISGIHMR